MHRIPRRATALLLLPALCLTLACGSRESRRDAHFQRAKQYLEEGKSAEGVIELKNTVQIDPKYVPAYALLAETALKERDYRNALAYYNKAVQLAPTNLDYVAPFANLLVAARQFDRLEEVLAALPEAARKEYRIATVEAAALQLQGKGEEAEKLLVALLDRQDLKPEERAAVNKALARMAAQGDRLAEAEQRARAAVEATPEDAEAILLLAQVQERRGRVKEAEATLKQAPEAVRQDNRYLAGLIGFYGRQKRLEEVKRVVEGLVARKELSPEGRLLAADTLLRLNEVGRAEEVLREGIEAQHPDRRVITAFVRLKAAEGRLAEAVAALEEAKGRVKPPSELHTQLARLYLQQRQVEKAKGIVDEILAANADDFAGRVLQAQVELLSKEPQKALDHFRELLRDAPKDPQVHRGLAGAHLALGEELLARQELEKVLEVSPENTTARIQLARLYLKDKDEDTALARLEPLAEMNAPPPQGIEMLLTLLVRKGKVERAHEVIDTLVERFPQSPYYATFQAVLEARTGHLDKGIALLEKRVEAQPNSVQLLVALSQLYEWKGAGDKAIATYERILKLQPDNPTAANNIAFRLAEAGKELDRALKLAEGLTKRFPKDANVADTYAWVLFKRGETEKARAVLAKALEGKEQVPPVVRYHEAAIAFAAGDRDAASQAIERCLAAKPQGPWVKRAQALERKLKG